MKEANSDEGALVGGEQGGRGTGFSINGARTASTNIMLDGGDNNYLFTSGIGQEIPLDAVQEFSVITNNFSAQYGRASGGIVNLVTKSGTNRVTGTGYEFFRNEKLAIEQPGQHRERHREGHVQAQSARLQRWWPDREGQGALLLVPRIHRHPQPDHAEFTWVLTPEFIAQAPASVKNYFAAYGRGAMINGPILTRADVTAKLKIGAGAFNNLPAGLPVFGRVDVVIPTDGGRRFPAGQLPDRQQSRLLAQQQDAGKRRSSRMQHVDAFVGTQSASPYPQYNSGQRGTEVTTSTPR